MRRAKYRSGYAAGSAPQRGAVLILVLWVTILLTILLGAFSLAVRVDRHVASDMVQQVRARAAGDAVLSYLAAVRLVDDAVWADMAGEVFVLPWEGFDVRFRFIPESAFVSLNAADEALLAEVFAGLEVPDPTGLAAMVVSRRTGAAEEAQVGDVNPWASVDELALLGGGLDRVASLGRYFSADSASATVSLEFADPLLQEWLGGAAAGVEGFEPQPHDAELIRVQVAFGVAPEVRRAEFVVSFGEAGSGYRLLRTNLYNARFGWD